MTSAASPVSVLPVLPELGFYTLAGSPDSARELIDEVIDGERLGLGTCFISERYNRKEIGVLSGAAGAVSERIQITTAATNHNTRHPMVTAAIARTMQSLTGGRFVLGLGRGIAPMQDAYGIPRITTAQLEDFVDIMRRLFRGEVDHRSRRTGREVSGAAPRCLARRVPADGHRRLRKEHPRARRPLLRRGRSAHLLHRRDHRPLRPDGEGRGRAGRSRSCFGTRVVVLRDRRRPHPRRQAADEDGRAARHLSAGLRRPAGAHQRLGPRRARPLPGRRGGQAACAASTSSAPPSSSSTSPR